MNTIGMIGRTTAMDGQNVNNSSAAKSVSKAKDVETPMPTTAAEVLQNMEKSRADIEASARELQRLSDMVTGHKLRFNVNEELNEVVVTVVNASTNEVIRQIPSEDIQKFQTRMKHAMGVLFDEMI